ncbi:MAG: DUF4848 domain-containing protein, partial [Duncaniella sp.]|nr:DUF4848 domain-containing protein [Duncaniella sp.]
MKTFIHSFVITVIMALCFSACGSDDELIPVSDSSTGVMVAKQSDYMVSQSRSSDDRQILVFPDKESFHQTVEMLKEMTEGARIQYFDSIGFKGAYSLLHNANLELDVIFDNESLDSCEFQNEIYKYIDKYHDMLAFNREEDRMEDEYWDVTPSLIFNDENMYYVGSVDGNVVIGDELVSQTSTLVAGPEEIITPIVKTCEVSINHGKYKSFLSIGRKGPYFAFKVQTYRKKGFTIKQ